MVAPPSLQLGHTVNIRHADISPLPLAISKSSRSGREGGRLDGGTSIVLQEQRDATGASSEGLWLKESLAERQEGTAKRCEYTSAPPGLRTYDDWPPYDAVRLAPPTQHPLPLPRVVDLTHDANSELKNRTIWDQANDSLWLPSHCWIVKRNI